MRKLNAMLTPLIIELQAGMSFNDLRATQSGNDLLLTIRGTDQGMTLKDYYTTPQGWLVQDSAGAQQGVADVLNATNQDEYSALRDDFFAATKVSIANNYLVQGYQWQADGVDIGRVRWRSHAVNLRKATAANDETNQIWRVAA